VAAKSGDGKKIRSESLEVLVREKTTGKPAGLEIRRRRARHDLLGSEILDRESESHDEYKMISGQTVLFCPYD
jgi:hypothetical protein